MHRSLWTLRRSPARRPGHGGVLLWALVLVLSMVSYTVHLMRASAYRGEAALALEGMPLLANQAVQPLHPRRHR